MQCTKLDPLFPAHTEPASLAIFKPDGTSTCCVCLKMLVSSDSVTSWTTEPLARMTTEPLCRMSLCCGIVCKQICLQMYAFVQGFVFCKMLCALLNKSSAPSVSKNRTLETMNHGLPEHVSPCSSESVSSSLPISPLHLGNCNGTLPCESETLQSGSHLNSERSGKTFSELKKYKSKHDVHSARNVRKSKPTFTRKRKKLVRGEKMNKELRVGGQDLAVPNQLHTCANNRRKMHEFAKEPGFENLSHTKSSSKAVKLKVTSSKNPKKKIMVCRICGKMCIGQAGLSVHTQIRHAGEKAVECELCAERFTCSRDCEKHRKKVHQKMEGVCHICGKHFKYRHALVAHIKAHTGVKGFVCEQCGKAFLRMTTLCSHRKRAHCCKVCQAELVSGQCPDHPAQSQSHPKRPSVQDSLNMLQCRECSETLDNLAALEAHMKAHKLQRPHHCRVCGNGFHTLSSLTKHSKQHQEKRFKCTLCDKTFTYKCNMQKHLETHVEGRPFQCEFCSKTFKTRGVMEKHLAMHVEDKQYKCHLCGKGLTRLQTLKNHMMKMHPDSGISGSITESHVD